MGKHNLEDKVLEDLKDRYIEVVDKCMELEEEWGKYNLNTEHNTCIVEIQLLEDILHKNYGYELDYFNGNLYMSDKKLIGKNVLIF